MKYRIKFRPELDRAGRPSSVPDRVIDAVKYEEKPEGFITFYDGQSQLLSVRKETVASIDHET